MTLQRTDRLRALIDVAEHDATLTAPGDPAELAFLALTDRLTGITVSRVGFALDPRLRTMRVEVDVPNPRGLLRPGMSASATLRLQKRPAGFLRVPLAAVVASRTAGRDAVYVVRDGKAHRVLVRAGLQDDKEVEVASAGLKPGDSVVADARGLTGEVVPVTVQDAPPK